MARRTGVKWNHALFTYKDQLHALPATLEGDAQRIMDQSAISAKSAIYAAYPIGPGNRGRPGGALREGLTLRNVKLGVKLIQRAPHAWIFDFGTKKRKTKKGYNRGRMKKRPTFRPIAKAYQTAAVEQIKGLIASHGAARVSGQANV